MPDKSQKFNYFALRSILFRGRHDWYFCYLKAERIAHVLAVLANSTPEGDLDALAHKAAMLPGEICRLAAGEFDAPIVLADVMSLLSAVRIAATKGALHKDHAQVLCAEYEHLAERLVAGSHPSPFGPEDFAVPQMLPGPERLVGQQKDITDIKDTLKKQGSNKGQSTRASLILEALKTHKTASIKALAAAVTGCSEKTIQRELANLIEQGLVRKTGERRWSVYSLA